MSRWSRKTDEEKAAAAQRQKENSTSKEDEVKALVQKSHDMTLENHEIPLFCTKYMLWTGANSYTIENRVSLISDGPVPMYVGICRGCKCEHTRAVIGEPVTSALLAQLAFELMKKGKLVDRRKM